MEAEAVLTAAPNRDWHTPDALKAAGDADPIHEQANSETRQAEIAFDKAKRRARGRAIDDFQN
jgi:hypothetical protein